MTVVAIIIAGLSLGSIYSLASVGLVLTYKTSGIFNLAHGSIATIAAFSYYTLTQQWHVPVALAIVLVLVINGPVVALVMESIARVVADKSVVVRVAGTVGVLLAVQAGAVLIYGSAATRTVPDFLPTRGFHFPGGLVVTADRIVIFAFVAVVTAVLGIYLKVTRMGVAMRAVVSNSSLLDVSGTNPVAVRRSAWLIGVSFASASGILLSQYVSLDGTVLTLLVVQAFGASAIGGFTNLPRTYAGGLAIGVASALCTKYFTSGILSGLSSAVPFIVLFVVLLFARRGRLTDRGAIAGIGRSSWTVPWTAQAPFLVGLAVLLYFVPQFANIHLADWTTFLAMTIVFLSLGLLVRTSGQVSLCQISFMAVGAAAFSHLTVDYHWPWLLALLVAGLIAVPIGALLAMPAIRLGGLYLALATFGFGVILSYMFYTSSFMFGSIGLGLQEPRPSWLGTSSDTGYYYLVLVLVALATMLVVVLTRSRLGRLLRASADSSTGLTTAGASLNVTRVLVFCLSAFLAAVGGALAGGASGIVTSDSYAPLTSLTYFAVVVITVGSEPWYALIAAAGLTLIPSYFQSAKVSYYLELVFGIAALLYCITPESLQGMPPFAQRRIDKLRWRRGTKGLAESVTGLAGLKTKPGALAASGVQVHFGGLIAVKDVSLEVGTGKIIGLIGPNGAGKTSMFNVCSGLNRRAAGSIQIDGDEVSRLGPAARARRGIGRTFQQMELFDSLSVIRNVRMGAEAKYAGVNPVNHLVSTRAQNRAVRATAQEAIAWCGIEAIAERPVGALSTGQRRLVELARCLAGDAHILLLDEPSSGLDRAETQAFGEIINRVVKERGVGVLIVEHDMALVTAICDYIYVLDFGVLLFEGSPHEVMASAVVRDAYLGQEDVEIARVAEEVS